MPAWVEPEKWEGLVSGAACPICRQGKPYGVVVELEHSYLTADRNVKIRGYCSLVWKKHVVELHELSEADAGALMRELRIVSAAIAEINEPVKLNHEIHGNTIPHLHVHVIPRYRGDELEQAGKTVGSLSREPYGAGEFEAFKRRLAATLSGQVERSLEG